MDAGWLTASQLRSRRVTRLLRGVYSWSDVPVTHELRCQAAGLVVPEGAALTGRSLATVLGVPLSSAWEPVEVAVPEVDRFGPVRGLLVRRVCTGPVHSRRWTTWRLADQGRLAFDLSARHPLPRAVAHLDAVAAAGHLDVDAVTTWTESLRQNDVRSVRAALALVDPRAESLKESELRVVLHQAGIVTVPQVVVHDDLGRFVARVDLAVPALRVAIEYDGAWHADRRQLERDRERLNRLRESGWTVVSVTAAMLADRGRVVEEVRRELTRRVVRA